MIDKPEDGRKNNKGQKGRNWMWHTTNFFCPHCHKKFSYKDMWISLSNNFPSIWEIMDFLKMSWPVARGCLKRYGCEDRLSGTKENHSWVKISQKMGFKTPTEMFGTLRDKRRITYTTMAKMMGKKPNEVKYICESFIGIKGTGKRNRRIIK